MFSLLLNQSIGQSINIYAAARSQNGCRLISFFSTCHQSTIIGTGKWNGWVAIVSYSLFALERMMVEDGLIALSHGEMDEIGLAYW